MAEPSARPLETVWEDEALVLSRSPPDGERPGLLVVRARPTRPGRCGGVRLEHEWALRESLDPAWAARPLELVRRDGQQTLLLEDPGGELLARQVGRPWGVEPFLRVAIGLAGALRGVHGRGLIHKDVKPGNVLADAVTGEVWLTGFGIASRFPRERQAPEPPEVIAGTLAYMAPEQTGRMNRSVDSRSDLYACGVTLYELLTGALPFAATEPMEWVHCHVARQPVPPAERVAGVPVVLSAIVMKLLAKAGEERYQTAAGLEADLRRCLAGWERRGRIEPFPLGAHDAPDRLRIPEKLYGREAEIETLLAAFERVVNHGAPELVLVRGYSGIGKSSVVRELHGALVPSRGLFAAGKFDQYRRDIPYATIAQAFDGLVRPILAQGEAELGRWRDALRRALGPNGQLVVSLVPELERVTGPQPPLPDLPAQEAQNRFQLVFRRFLGTFARREHPLVLFLDDLQWLDAATLHLLEHLLTAPDVRHLLVIGAYRDNEVGPGHPLAGTLEAIRRGGGRVREIVLGPLVRDDVGRLVADALRCDRDRAEPLARLVHEKTGGNPFFAIQFLTALVEEGLLALDPHAAGWTWELARIRAKGFTDNVVDLMVGKLTRLPAGAREALKLLACLGNRAERATLALVLEASGAEVDAALWEAVRAGLVEPVDGAYAFLHDRVQEAAYALLPPAERPAVHLRIGRLLAARTPPGELEERIFEIVNQLDRGASLLRAEDERERVVELDLLAGKRARASTAYASALRYLAAGEAMLPADAWSRRHALAFGLSFHRAECEFLTGDLPAAEARLAALSGCAGDHVERAAVTCVRAALYMTAGRSDRAIEVGLEYLRQLGVDWSPHPGDEEVRLEYDRIWRQLGDRSIDALVDLPPMRDPEWRATLDVLVEVLPPASWADRNLYCLVVARMANVSLEHGNTDASCIAYGYLGMILGPFFGDDRAGFAFGKLAEELVERRGLDRFAARVHLLYGHHVVPWMHHLHAARPLIRRAFVAAQDSGDLTFAAYACANLVTNLLASGEPLPEVEREAALGLEFARNARFGLIAELIAGQLALVRTLRGGTGDGGAVGGVRPGERRDGAGRPDVLACWTWIREMQARCHVGDPASAVEPAARAEPLLWTSYSFFEVAEYHLYAAVAHAAAHDRAPGAERGAHLEAVRASRGQLAAWAEHCPANFDSRVALVDAELARLEGRDVEAMRLHERAVALARESGFVQLEALAHDLAARFHVARGLDTIAHAHLRASRDAHARWGADGKVRQLEERHPSLRAEVASPRPTTTIGASVEQLDLAMVVRTSQAVSGEIVLERLIRTLMVIAVEHAGAARGLLVLPSGDEHRIHAEATTAPDGIAVRLLEAPATSTELPRAVLEHVLRTGERVILDDAAISGPFTDDPYVIQRRARSILCLPLVKQARPVGVLYLENDLAPGVFTPARTSVLELLASQAAISLENARLYGDLERALGELGALKDRLQHENLALKEEIDRSSMFEEIVGRSPALRAVLGRVAKVAPTDSTVLITGETGTGKELFARAIHKRSQRAARAFVGLNCAAVPATLILSELFGHEKGAFTGALQRRLGRFELADGGTLFLDEIGELSMETQVALLRVLQEREFERVGGSQPLRADVRVIAATNRDLRAAIDAGTFRSDLFYRLGVFPIEVPPLRDRREDVPLLVEHLVARYASAVGKRFARVDRRTLERLQAYPWPGNVRELQNVIERSVILCETDTFSVDESWLGGESSKAQPVPRPFREKLASREREMIEAALAESGGKVSGPAGAAARLGIPPSTLDSRIRSLRISKHRFRHD
ncbi:sigma 54-interacting transcriptional regulator [Anaeromyxobacter oryzae]|uniref:Signal transduction histidine kinase n=1 Tax=Anaeromyxobacter oryzae TaxID=2918170 RepID=A0ABM7X1D7_9BACT|nr:sigma 54-interacting transcriptional regulator [Anaeromyxobacter oryzae]BDG05594.1 signal transduction histidine kinase [Anaeromyxobacter oryzae]